MFQFRSTYRNYFIVVLTILFFVPCTLKRDLKQQFAQEIFQNSQQSNAKTISSTTCTANLTSIELQKQVEIQKFIPAFTEDKTAFIPETPLSLDKAHGDEFTQHKEKIPTYIRLQLYLI
ncbi:hypothetical protein NMK71_11055 [Weeksellaceae bacterium KMM 9713]|uniref:Uncharacterized protein n=1 Tax=Profundicola chukchiensis TaxID=2961959 RepID=A0A9X4RWD5_9FLAO|nr:hypothetical protein [Profundicola chukchiensis]MDG4946950.1 hypothetical protein [Profundicola chukchiensis]